jgi:cation transport protein ChaC
LRERELVTDVYKETKIRVRLHDGCEVRAIAYVVDTRHPQFAGRLDRSETLRLVREGVGRSGPNPQYVTATARHLSELGIIDVELEWLSKQLESRSF